MKIEHIALWTKDLERSKEFYCKYFYGTSNEKYFNPLKQFESYFISFPEGARLELMRKPSLGDHLNHNINVGLTHIAFSVGTKSDVDTLTEQLRKDGYPVIGEPRTTGDGYYESVILDPDGNYIEITAH